MHYFTANFKVDLDDELENALSKYDFDNIEYVKC